MRPLVFDGLSCLTVKSFIYKESIAKQHWFLLFFRVRGRFFFGGVLLFVGSNLLFDMLYIKKKYLFNKKFFG